jgi:hypothetical protein
MRGFGSPRKADPPPLEVDTMSCGLLYLWQAFGTEQGFAVPVSLFKSISITFGGAGLIFECLDGSSECGNGIFCRGFSGANPQRSERDKGLWILFFGEDMLFEKETGTASIVC